MSEGDSLSRNELRTATLSGVRWATTARLGAELLGLVSMVTLARLIPPAEFGHAVIALVVVTFAVIVNFEFVGVPLVQTTSVTRRQLEAAVVASLGLGVLLCSATLLFGITAAATVFDARTAEFIQLVAPAFLLGALGAVPRAMLQRRLDFAAMTMIEVASLASGLLTSIVLALAGLDAEAIVLGSLTTAALATLILVLRGPLPRPRWHRDGMRDLASFGLASGLAATMGSTFRNVDYAIVGARLGAAQLGFYWRGFQLGVMHQGKISGIMLRIALPVYSRATSLQDMRALRRRITRAHATVILPLQATLIAVAPVLVPWLFGPRWEPAVVPTQILAVAGMFLALLTGVGPLVTAVGRPRALLAFNAASLAAYAGAVYVAAPYGLTAVCATAVLVYAGQLACAQVLLLRRLVGIPVREFGSDAGPGGVSSLALLGVTLGFMQVAETAGLPAAVTLALAAPVAAGTYLLTLRALFPPAWGDLALLGRLAFRRRGHRRRGGAGTGAGATAGAPARAG